MKAFNEWNPWMKLDPQLQSTYSGVSGQIGDKHCWKSDKKDVEMVAKKLRHSFQIWNKVLKWLLKVKVKSHFWY